MSAPHELRARARRWLRWSQEDLALARGIAAEPELVPRGACAWAQQAAEKALKALLVDADIDPPKSHDLARLNAMLDAAVPVEDAELVELSRWSIEGRDPADLDEATALDAQASLDTAHRVVAEVARRLRPEPEGGR